MKRYRKLTLQQLKDRGACQDQLRVFAQTFGESVNVTEARAIKVAHLFVWSWATEYLLSPSARADYERAAAAALADYMRAEAAAWADYKHAKAAALADYQRAKAAAWADYQRAAAAAWARAYLGDGA